jgi:N-acetyl-anhydromuramyl-L-alanine amidase AmpD
MLAFISYASEDRDLAEQIHLALTGAGHQTFFDKESLPPGGDFHSRIRAAVQQSDLFLFLISPESVAPGSYALTELKYARARWPHPLGHVLPVLVRRVEFEKIPNYLKAVTVLEPEGNLAAEILVAVSDLLKPREGLGGLSKEPSVAAPKELPSAKPALTKSTVWLLVLLLGLVGMIGLSSADRDRLVPSPPVPDKGAPSESANTTQPMASKGDEKPQTPASEIVQKTDALEGLWCRLPSPGQNPIVSRAEEIAPPEYSIDKQRHLLLAKDGKPVSVIPATSWGSLKSLRFIVVHFTAGPARGVEAFFQRPREEISASAHVLIRQTGAVSQFVPFDLASRHAGVSHWKDVSGLNPYSIGIELESWGRLERKDGAWVTAIGGKKISEAEVVHDPKNETIGWQRFTDAQLRSFFAVACALRRAYPTIEDVVGHSQINPARIDPGPAFPMEEVRRRLFIDAKEGS